MWISYQFIMVIGITAFGFIISSRTLTEFALFSEFLWLVIYVFSIILGSTVGDNFLLSAPLIILLITATEGVVVWLLIILSSRTLVLIK